MKYHHKRKLVSCRPGRNLKVRHIDYRDNQREKILLMGILPGGKIKIINVQKNGPLLIVSGGTRLALDLKTAESIICCEE